MNQKELGDRFRSFFIRTGLLVVMLLAVTSSVWAHEERTVGPKGEYSLVIGWFYEPAFEDVINAVDVYVTRSSDKKAVNTGKGDIVDLEVEVQLRASEDDKAPIRQSVRLQEKPRLTFRTENRYNAWFRPTQDGAYAFRIKGTISDASNPTAGPVTIDETFVCGKGSRSHHGFVCIVDPQAFPGGPGKDKSGYRDDD